MEPPNKGNMKESYVVIEGPPFHLRRPCLCDGPNRYLNLICGFYCTIEDITTMIASFFLPTRP